VHFTAPLLSAAAGSPITLGIFLGYVVGKPIGVSAGAWLATRPALHGPRSPLSGPLLVASGACAGIGFTVSLLISSLAFTGERLSEAKIGALASVIAAPVVTAVILRGVRRLPSGLRASQISRTAEDLLDLAVDVDPERDHIRGPDSAPVTLLEYGDFECPYCGQAEAVIRELLASAGADVRYVWRHLPLNDVHPSAQFAAEASEAAAAQSRFWDMHDRLLAHEGTFTMRHLTDYARELGLDGERFFDELRRREYAARVSEDVATADESGVSGTPTFFINGRRHYGVYDIAALTDAVRAAKARARVAAQPPSGDAEPSRA
jgi:protein-disulfide isomerase